jgi:hypothetical protein
VAFKKLKPVAYFDYTALKEVVNLVVKNNPYASKPPDTFTGSSHQFVTKHIIDSIEFLLSHPDTTSTGTMGYYVIAQDQFDHVNPLTGVEETCVVMNIVYDPVTLEGGQYAYYRDGKMWIDLTE